MTNIKINKNKIIFDGHADDLETCNTITNICNSLNSNPDFETIKYEPGYAEFNNKKKVANAKLVFAPEIEASYTILEGDNTVASTFSYLTDGSGHLYATLHYEINQDKIFLTATNASFGDVNCEVIPKGPGVFKGLSSKADRSTLDYPVGSSGATWPGDLSSLDGVKMYMVYEDVQPEPLPSFTSGEELAAEDLNTIEAKIKSLNSSYVLHNFKVGDVLHALALNEMQDGILVYNPSLVKKEFKDGDLLTAAQMNIITKAAGLVADVHVFGNFTLGTDTLLAAEPPRDELLGIWVFDPSIDLNDLPTTDITFVSDHNIYNRISANFSPMPPLPDGGRILEYGQTKVYEQYDTSNKNHWEKETYKTIRILDTSALGNRTKFTSWLKANAKPRNLVLGVSGEPAIYYNQLPTADTYNLLRTDDAVGLKYNVVTSNITGVSKKITSDFDNIYPYNDITEVIDSLGNKFIRIPKFYTQYICESSGGIGTKICSAKLNRFWKLNPCFIDSDGKELPYIDIGKYQASGTNEQVRSTAGRVPLGNITSALFRQACMSNGEGYQQLDIWVYELIATLFKIEFATINTNISWTETTSSGSTSSKYLSLGGKYVGSTPRNTGVTDVLGANATGVMTDGSVVYRGIEDVWGNMYQWIDGINFYENNIYVDKNPQTYSNDKTDGDYKKINYQMPNLFKTSFTSGGISRLGYDLENSFVRVPSSFVLGETYFSDSNHSRYGVLYRDSQSLNTTYSYGEHSRFYMKGSNLMTATNGGRLVKRAILSNKEVV